MATLDSKQLQTSTIRAPVQNTAESSPQSLHWSLFTINAVMMFLGGGGPLLLRVYFLHGGQRLWLSSFIQVAGWPVLLLPLLLSYLRRRSNASASSPPPPLYHLTPPLAAACACLGILFGLSCYVYAIGSSYLPLSTSSLLFATQLAFTATFAFFLVKQRFTAFSVNAVVLLTAGPAVLALHGGSDRPEGVTVAKYYLGFFMTLAAAGLIGLLLPLMEIVIRRCNTAAGGGRGKPPSYAMVMEIQLVMGVAGTVFCLAGMLIDKDFQVIPREAKDYGLGEVKYYLVIIWDTIFWQLTNVALVGIISSGSSLVGGILIAILLPFTEVLSVIFLHEKFDGGKGLSLVLCLWGFISYLYGEMKEAKKVKKRAEVEAASIIP